MLFQLTFLTVKEEPPPNTKLVAVRSAHLAEVHVQTLAVRCRDQVLYCCTRVVEGLSIVDSHWFTGHLFVGTGHLLRRPSLVCMRVFNCVSYRWVQRLGR